MAGITYPNLLIAWFTFNPARAFHRCLHHRDRHPMSIWKFCKKTIRFLSKVSGGPRYIWKNNSGTVLIIRKRFHPAQYVNQPGQKNGKKANHPFDLTVAQTYAKDWHIHQLAAMGIYSHLMTPATKSFIPSMGNDQLRVAYSDPDIYGGNESMRTINKQFCPCLVLWCWAMTVYKSIGSSGNGKPTHRVATEAWVNQTKFILQIFMLVITLLSWVCRLLATFNCILLSVLLLCWLVGFPSSKKQRNSIIILPLKKTYEHTFN